MATSPPDKTPTDTFLRILKRRCLGTSTAATLAACVTVSFAHVAYAQPAPATCDGWHAEVSAVEGTVEALRAGTPEWRRVAQGDSLCKGDAVRAQAFSRATVRLPDQTVI